MPSELSWYRSTLPAGVTPNKLRFITCNNKMHFVWFTRGNGELGVSRGVSNDLDKHGVNRSILPAGTTVNRIRFLAANDVIHFAFQDNGAYIAGRSDRLDSERLGVRYHLPRLMR